MSVLSPFRVRRNTIMLCAAALLVPCLLLMWPFERVVELHPIGSHIDVFSASHLPLNQSSVGSVGYRPLITNVQVYDLDADGLPDIIACDARRQAVIWYRQVSRGEWREHVLTDRDLAAPCHTTMVDLNGDGRVDIVVAVLGDVYPTNERVGQVVWLENRGQEGFRTHVILDDIRRVADVQVGDLNGDGIPDLVVAEFGFDQGRVFWMEGRGNGKFRDRELLCQPGAINVHLVDLNGDSKLDIVALMSQDDEEIWAFENLGSGKFRPHLMLSQVNFDLGSVGLVKTDLDRDGKPDFLLVAGDNLELRYPVPQSWHGCFWLRPQGPWSLQSQRIATFGGAYAAAVGDLDGDGDDDVVLVSMYNDWTRPGSASVIWLENDGAQHFKAHHISDHPTNLATVACGDLNGDGRADIVAGGLHMQEPFDRVGRITTWTSTPPAPAATEIRRLRAPGPPLANLFASTLAFANRHRQAAIREGIR